MGFVSLALVLTCVLFWGVVIMLITHSTWAILVARFVLVLIITFLLVALILYLIKTIYKKLLAHGYRKPSKTKESTTIHQILDTDVKQ